MRLLLRLLTLGRPARGPFALGALLALIVLPAHLALPALAGCLPPRTAAAGPAGSARYH